MSFEDKTVFIPIDFSKICDKKYKVPLMLYFADNSVYIEDEDVRVYPEKVNYSEVARQTTLKDRKAVKRALDYLMEIDNSVVYCDESKDKICFNNNQDFVISLSHKTLRRMYTNFSDYTCKIFLYLYRQHCYWTTVRNSSGFNFTLSQLCESIGLSPQSKNREVVKESLNQLVINGMIGYDIIKKGNTYYRKLTNITTDFVVNDLMNGFEEHLVGGLLEKSELPEEFQEGEIISHVGLDYGFLELNQKKVERHMTQQCFYNIAKISITQWNFPLHKGVFYDTRGLFITQGNVVCRSLYLAPIFLNRVRIPNSFSQKMNS